jgi:hypothetical protein
MNCPYFAGFFAFVAFLNWQVRTERNAKTTTQLVENPWTLFAQCSPRYSREYRYRFQYPGPLALASS